MRASRVEPTSFSSKRGPGSQSEDAIADKALYTLIYLQGVTALRRGETDNCVMCRGESSCILPIAPAAVHTRRDRFPPGDPPLHRVSREVSRTIRTSAGC